MLPEGKTIVLLNKTDLLAPLSAAQYGSILRGVERALGAEKAWMVSISTRDGIASFLREFGDILKQR